MRQDVKQLDATRAEFVFRSVPFCPRLQRPMIALAARGAGWVTEDIEDVWPLPEGYPQMAVRQVDLPTALYFRTIPMIDVIESFFPERPLYPADPAGRAADQALMQMGRGLQLRLSDVTHATDSVAHDIAVFRLTSRLRLIEGVLSDELPRETLDNPGVVFAPSLWRIRLLDRLIGSYLLASLPHLSAWADRLCADPSVLTALGPSPETRYMERVRSRNAVLIAERDRTVWSLLPSGGDAPRGAG